jgi:hypothetical protein
MRPFLLGVLSCALMASPLRLAIAAAPTYALGGFVVGLHGSLKLQARLEDLSSTVEVSTLAIRDNGEFAFLRRATPGTSYSITLLTQPKGQTCTLEHTAGLLTHADIRSITVSCASA